MATVTLTHPKTGGRYETPADGGAVRVLTGRGWTIADNDDASGGDVVALTEPADTTALPDDPDNDGDPPARRRTRARTTTKTDGDA